MSDAEVLCTVLVAAQFFGGNAEHACRLLAASPYIPGMLSRSLHQLAGPLGPTRRA